MNKIIKNQKNILLFLTFLFIIHYSLFIIPAANAQSSSVDLTWDATARAPASYKGKILPTRKSTVNISALFSGNNGLIFDWRLDDKFLSNKSGPGKSELSFIIDDYAGGDKSVRLEIKTPNNAIVATESISIPIARPQTLIYFADPETETPYGISLKNLIVTPTRLNFAAQNYFFNAPDKNLNWQWMLNNQEVAGADSKPWLASLDLSNIGALFSFQIQVAVKNPNNDLEMAQSTINLNIK